MHHAHIICSPTKKKQITTFIRNELASLPHEHQTNELNEKKGEKNEQEFILQIFIM